MAARSVKREKTRRGEDKSRRAPRAKAAAFSAKLDSPTLRSLLIPASPASRRVFAAIIILAFALRVYKLSSMLPILVDESIYLRWAEIIHHQGQWFISLLDGKQPLTYWILALTRMLWDGDPLFAGRMVSVLAGLCSTVGVFAVARLAAGEAAGLFAALLYAVFPYSLLYDRLAYTEGAVNLCGVAIVLTSLHCFQSAGSSWRREIPAGLALGLGMFTKQTVGLFAFFPALAGIWLGRKQSRNVWPRLALIYGVTAVFVALTVVTIPDAPTLETHSAVLHHTGFFVDPAEFMNNPFPATRENFERLAGFVAAYLTLPLTLATFASLAYLSWRRSSAAWLIFSTSLLPLAVQLVALDMKLPTRYPYPHFWPWMVVTAMAGNDLWERFGKKLEPAGKRTAAAALAAALIAGPMLYRSIGILRAPRENLHAEDVKGFMSATGHVGYGIREAVDYLIAESRSGPFVLLTDPIWGTPSDAMFPYLNHRYGIRVYEAWWMQLSGTHWILPGGTAEMIKSHYEREKFETVDFSKVPRVFYVTDTNYTPPPAVRIRQPDARLAASFPKPGGKHAINVYRLK